MISHKRHKKFFVIFVPFCGLNCTRERLRIPSIAAVCFAVVRAASRDVGCGCAGFLFPAGDAGNHSDYVVNEFFVIAVVCVGCSLLC